MVIEEEIIQRKKYNKDLSQKYHTPDKNKNKSHEKWY